MGAQPISELFLNNIDVLPLWVKQVLYAATKDKLQYELAEFMDVLLSDNLMQRYVPKITFAGKNELENHERRLSQEFYTFLQNCTQEYDLFEITLSNYWTFAQTCSAFVRLIELEFLHIPQDEVIVSIAEFMAGKIRTGEMLKRLGKIDIMQLENAIRLQKERADKGEPIKMATLMIELGYVTEKDIRILLAFKDDAKKRFVMGVGFSLIEPADKQQAKALFTSLQKEIKRLDEENRLLKNRLRKILNIKE